MAPLQPFTNRQVQMNLFLVGGQQNRMRVNRTSLMLTSYREHCGHGKIVNGNIVFKFIKHIYPSITVFQLGTRNYTSIAVKLLSIWFPTSVITDYRPKAD